MTSPGGPKQRSQRTARAGWRHARLGHPVEREHRMVGFDGATNHAALGNDARPGWASLLPPPGAGVSRVLTHDRRDQNEPTTDSVV